MKINQFGRSMVEMLGVLAIIGVLSVGAVAGYQKAMFKYKMNKTMDIISHAIHRVAELDNMKIGEEIEGAEHAIKYGIMPDCDVNYINIDGNKGSSCPLPLGEFRAEIINSMYGKLMGQFYITFTKQPFDSCVTFLSSDIYKNVPDDWWNMLCEDCDGGGFIYVTSDRSWKLFYGRTDYTLSLGATSNPTNQDILEACESCKDTDYCLIHWAIRNEY